MQEPNSNLFNYMLTKAFRKETSPGGQVTYTTTHKLTLVTAGGKHEIPEGWKLSMPTPEVVFFRDGDAGTEGFYIHYSAIFSFSVAPPPQFFIF